MKSWIFILIALIFAILAAYHLFILNYIIQAFFYGAISYAMLLTSKEHLDKGEDNG